MSESNLRFLSTWLSAFGTGAAALITISSLGMAFINPDFFVALYAAPPEWEEGFLTNMGYSIWVPRLLLSTILFAAAVKLMMDGYSFLSRLNIGLKETAWPSLDRMQQEVASWERVTFPTATLASRIRHLRKEALECEAAPYDIMEFADVLLLLMNAAAGAGHSISDVFHAANRKFEINRGREWGEPNADGFQEHIKKDAADEVENREIDRDTVITLYFALKNAIAAYEQERHQLFESFSLPDGTIPNKKERKVIEDMDTKIEAWRAVLWKAA